MTTHSCLNTIKIHHEHAHFIIGMLPKKNHMEIFPNLHMALYTITPTNNNQLKENLV
jgi:hypothetical protein